MADGILKVGTITTSSGSGTITLGQSGETVDMSNATQTGVGGVNTPAFEAYTTSQTSLSDNTETKVLFGTEVFDTDSCYSSSRFTPTVAGKYYCYAQVRGGGGANNSMLKMYVVFKKNGSYYHGSTVPLYEIGTSYKFNNMSLEISSTIDFNGSSDYLEVYVLVDSTTTPRYEAQASLFGGYKLIT